MAQLWLIERIDAAGGLFFSEKLGLDVGCPGGGWTPRREEATRFASEAAAFDRRRGLGFMAEMTHVVVRHVDDPIAPAPEVSFADLLQRPHRPLDSEQRGG